MYPRMWRSCPASSSAEISTAGTIPMPSLRGRVDRLLDAVDAVVIAQRHQLDAGRGGGLDDLASRERPVGMDGMTLKVESGRIG